MLRFKTLKSDKELQEFCVNYLEAVSKKTVQGFDLTLEAIKKKTKIVGVFQSGRMVAGYALSDIPFPLVANISTENRLKMEIVAPLDSCYDLGNIWKKSGFSKVLFSSIIWPRIVIDTLRFNPSKENVIGYVFTGHGRKDAYDLARPIYLQEDSTRNGLNIFVMTKKNLFIALAKGIVDEAVTRPIHRAIRLVPKVLIAGKHE
jgi:hypothetical protein